VIHSPVANHNHPDRAEADLTRPLLLAIAVTATFTVIEFVGGLVSDSLALISDASHMLTDTLALLLTLGAVRLALLPATDSRTFGYKRAEILAALANGTTLVVITLLIFYEAARRIVSPENIDSGLMLIIGLAGLGANAVGAYILHDRASSSLNIKGAFIHLLGDFLSSIGVVVAALLIMFFDLRLADPVLSILIGVIILYSSFKLVLQSTSILLEAVPSHIELDAVRRSLKEISGVTDVHDLHVWTLSSGLYALSAHLVVPDQMLSDCSGVLANSEDLLKEKFGISHTTFQIECETCADQVCIFQPPPRKR
jgi:cobalt-zinc-cadmium efflux system protein